MKELRGITNYYLKLALAKRLRFFGFLLFVAVAAIAWRSSQFAVAGIVDNSITGNVDAVVVALVTLLGIRVLATFLGAIKDTIGSWILADIMAQNRLQYLRQIQHLDYSFHANKSTGSLISAGKRGDGAIASAFIEINDSTFMVVVEMIFTVVALSFATPVIAAIFAVTFVSAILISLQFLLQNVRARKEANRYEDVASGILTDNLLAFETVKTFAQEDWEHSRYATAIDSWKGYAIRYMMTFRRIDIALHLTATVGMGAAILVGLQQLQEGSLTPGGLTVAVTLLFTVTESLVRLVYRFREIMKNYTDFQRLYEIMQLKTTVSDPALPKMIEEPQGELRFTDVSFGYGHSQEALRNVNLAIPAGQTVAFVGRSGAGKTTLTKLLMRFYDVDRGSITIDGVDIRDLSQRQLRKLIGLVPQDPVMFNETLRFNLKYARPEADDAEVLAAAAKAQLTELIAQLPLGLDTVIGERGIKLSGGQRQRLAIARVLLENPAIVIFDEATSQLDSENEMLVQKAFAELTAQKTTIVIAHRLSTIRRAQQIVVFENGIIVETGTHDSLTHKAGIYAHLWELQASPARIQSSEVVYTETN